MTETLGQVDVLVLGSGPGGMAGAIAAAEAGCSVGVVESMSTPGGNLPLSSGYVTLTGTELQRSQGVVDSPEMFLADLRRESERAREDHGGVLLDDVAEAYATHSGEAYEWLTSVGVRFRRLIERSEKHRAHRLHALENPKTASESLVRELDRLDVLLMPNLRAVEARRNDGRGFVVTMAEEKTGQTMSAEAALALIVATGGYQANFDMRAEVQPAWLADTPYLGLPTPLGDGHRIVAGLGGRLVNMSFLPPFSHIASSFVEGAIAVNVRGERFHDEMDPHETPRFMADQPGRRGFYVFDQTTMEAKSSYVAELGRRTVSADSLPDLASQLGIPGAGLEQTVEQFNAAVRAGDDAALPVGRSNLPATGIEQAPFHAVEVVVGVSVTYGGAATDPWGTVLDVYGETIPGLYAVGNANGSLAPAVQVGGVNLGSAIVLGRLAGAHSVRPVVAGAHRTGGVA